MPRPISSAWSFWTDNGPAPPPVRPRNPWLRYFWVLAPNAPLRPAVTGLASEQDADACAPRLDTTTDGASFVQAGARKARYLWAFLLARIYEAFPLTCPHCASEMRSIA